MSEFEELKRVAESATPGGWAVAEQKYPHRYMGHHIERMIVTAYDDGQLKSPYPIVTMATGIGIGDKLINFCHISEEDSAFIAVANPETILALIARIAELQVKADRYDYLARKTCVASGYFSFINLPEAPENWRDLQSSESLEIAIDAAIDAARGGV